MVQGWENIEVAVHEGFRVSWDECADALSWWICQFTDNNCSVTRSILRHGDATELINNIPYSLRDPLEQTDDAQHHLDQRTLWATLLLCFELGVAIHRSSPFFKTAKLPKNLSTASGILSESHFNHKICFSASFSYILTELNAHSFHFLGNLERDDGRNSPVLYLGWHKNEKS
jgi:hypothetical protein